MRKFLAREKRRRKLAEMKHCVLDLVHFKEVISSNLPDKTVRWEL